MIKHKLVSLAIGLSYMEGTTLYQQLESARYRTDETADAFMIPWLQSDQARPIMQALADTEKPLPDDFRKAVETEMESSWTLPSWADMNLIKQGCVFYQKYWFNIQIMLGCYSLPYCYLAADGVKVLYMSKQLRENVVKRLQLTNDFVLRCIKFENYQNGLVQKAVIRPRLFHAANRYHILQSGKWQESFGAPINQEDMAGTNLAFSFISIRGLRKLGYTVSKEEAEAYQHLWNVVGHLMGVEEAFLPHTLHEAHELDACIVKRQFRPSLEAKELTQALVEGIKTGVPQNQKKFIAGFMRYLLGADKADLLELKPETMMQPGLSIVLLQHQFRNVFGITDSKKPIPPPISGLAW